MSLASVLARVLDRRGGRSILGWLSTLYARYKLRVDIEITHRGIWCCRVNQYYIPNSNKFNYGLHSLFQLTKQENQRREDSEDFWFPFYRPMEGDVIVDVGAGRGEDLPAFVEAVGKTGKVVAIEAHPRSFAELSLLCRLNQFRNVILVQAAAMDARGQVTLTDLDDWESNAVDQAGESSAIQVQADTIDNICESQAIDAISFLKINIEGAERAALLGMNRMIRKCKAICVACHDFRADRGESDQFRTRSFVESYLADRGFRIVSRPLDPREYVRDHIFGLK